MISNSYLMADQTCYDVPNQNSGKLPKQLTFLEPKTSLKFTAEFEIEFEDVIEYRLSHWGEEIGYLVWNKHGKTWREKTVMDTPLYFDAMNQLVKLLGMY
jgi:hypothetical protein